MTFKQNVNLFFSFVFTSNSIVNKKKYTNDDSFKRILHVGVSSSIINYRRIKLDVVELIKYSVVSIDK